VLAPWRDIDPEASLPGQGLVRDLLAGLDTGGIRRPPGMVLLRPAAGPHAGST
jgi:2-amino-4-hydroxy-6-hydroxymethyldihydropteridine diphosphokinase